MAEYGASLTDEMILESIAIRRVAVGRLWDAGDGVWTERTFVPDARDVAAERLLELRRKA